jgi:hypothetical protein
VEIHWRKVGTLPPVGDLLDRIREHPKLAVGIGVGTLLLLAWIGWAIHVTSENGADAGLGVVIAWPALLAALAIVSLPFVGGYFLIRRLSTEDRNPGSEASESPKPSNEATDEASSDEATDEEREEATEPG